MKKLETEEHDASTHLLAKLEAGGYRDYTKTLIFITAGAYALSFFILDRMQSPNYMLFLVYTWLFWTVALLMLLASLSTYPKAIREAFTKSHDEPNHSFWMMHKMNLIGTILFGLGIFFFIVFVLYNLNCF